MARININQYYNDINWGAIQRELAHRCQMGEFGSYNNGSRLWLGFACCNQPLEVYIEYRVNYSSLRFTFVQYQYVVEVPDYMARQYMAIGGGGNPQWEEAAPKKKTYTCKSCKEEGEKEHGLDKRGECFKTREAFAVKVRKLHQHRKSKELKALVN